MVIEIIAVKITEVELFDLRWLYIPSQGQDLEIVYAWTYLQGGWGVSRH
jgi:hypothetical protein